MSFSMKLQRKVGTTGCIIEIFIENSAAAGTGKSGLAYNTSSLTAYYKRNTASASVAITLASVTTFGTFVSGGFKEVDSTNMVGVYELHIPNAALASGADNVLICLQGATGMFPVVVQIELTQTDNQDAQNGGMATLATVNTNGDFGLNDTQLNNLIQQVGAQV